MENHKASANHLPYEKHTASEAFLRLLGIMDELREQCPWDKKQSFESLRHLTIEETYELAEAILKGNLEEIKKEVGDVLLHMVFYAKLGSEQGAFNITTVIHSLCEKLISRHPHIYGEAKASNEEEVKTLWEQVKQKEKGNEGVLAGVPSALPAMVKAYRIQSKARGAGFDWEEKSQVWEKVREELNEFHEALETGRLKAGEEAEAEFGDVLFSLINYARFQGINPEDALERTNQKFIRRFSHMEKAVKAMGKNLSEMSLQEMDSYWEKAKEELG